MQRKPIIAGNWKMNCTVEEAVQLVTGLKRELFDVANVEKVVCPPFTLLSTVSELLESTDISLGAQDVFWEKKGAYTGEISPVMLKDIGCKYVIIGHSERRKYFGETDGDVNRKVKAALEEGLFPIICVGETREQREVGQTEEVVKRQIEGAFEGISSEEILKCVIAYEPVWAIGTGINATPSQAEEVHAFIRNELLTAQYGNEIPKYVRIQYGGSVNPQNISDLMKEPDINGALVGGASLKVDSFVAIIKKTQELYSAPLS